MHTSVTLNIDDANSARITAEIDQFFNDDAHYIQLAVFCRDKEMQSTDLMMFVTPKMAREIAAKLTAAADKAEAADKENAE